MLLLNPTSCNNTNLVNNLICCIPINPVSITTMFLMLLIHEILSVVNIDKTRSITNMLLVRISPNTTKIDRLICPIPNTTKSIAIQII